MLIHIQRRLACRDSGKSQTVGLSIDIPFAPESGSKILDIVAGKPVEVHEVVLDPSHAEGPRLVVLLEPMSLPSDYDLHQWTTQYEATGWRQC